ncbi:hypothetical protein GCM10007383_36070 [Arenibacter certesii]|uniref:Uncharacterized protein n=1 Tax=Arenibacter certesii TaxID=228955 RepID=A0A918J560_9FLAO|nr:hypothetical protein GCM10007383_36070 [Arenibacter certesii]
MIEIPFRPRFGCSLNSTLYSEKRKKNLISRVLILIIGFPFPQNCKMLVKGATKAGYNSKSFWYYP